MTKDERTKKKKEKIYKMEEGVKKNKKLEKINMTKDERTKKKKEKIDKMEEGEKINMTKDKKKELKKINGTSIYS